MNVVAMCRGSISGRCTRAGPRPRCESTDDTPMTTSAALTTPKSDGESRRASVPTITIWRTVFAPLPQALHNIPPMIRWVRLLSLASCFMNTPQPRGHPGGGAVQRPVARSSPAVPPPYCYSTIR